MRDIKLEIKFDFTRFTGKVAQHEKKLLSQEDYERFQAKGSLVPAELHAESYKRENKDAVMASPDSKNQGA